MGVVKKQIRGCGSKQGSEIPESSPNLKGERQEESNANVLFLWEAEPSEL